MGRLGPFDANYDLQNTSQMSLRPDYSEDFHLMDSLPSGDMRLMLVMSGDQFRKTIGYAVMVEMWEKKKSGRVKRAWEAQFTQAERNKIATYYGRFYRWYLVTGLPQKISMQLRTIELLQKACNFFASI